MNLQKKNSTITADRLREILHYEPDTGVFRWLSRRSNVQAGAIAGCCSKGTFGYVLIRIDGVLYQAHRLAWLYTHGAWPAMYVDHADLCRANNRIRNLREADHSENNANCDTRSTSKVGLKGVRKNKGKFTAVICKYGIVHQLGSFTTAEAAHQAYSEAAIRLHGEFARAGSSFR